MALVNAVAAAAPRFEGDAAAYYLHNCFGLNRIRAGSNFYRIAGDIHIPPCRILRIGGFNTVALGVYCYIRVLDCYTVFTDDAVIHRVHGNAAACNLQLILAVDCVIIVCVN